MKNEKLLVLLHNKYLCCSLESFRMNPLAQAVLLKFFYLVGAHTGKFLFTELLQKPEHIFVINLEKRYL